MRNNYRRFHKVGRVNLEKGLHTYISGHCEEHSDEAICYDYMKLEIASHLFAMTLYKHSLEFIKEGGFIL